MTARSGRKGSLAVTEHGSARVVGYIRVSTTEQGDSGAGLEAQRLAIKAEVVRRGWRLVGIHEDVMSGSTVNGRHGLSEALAAVESGKARTLVVAKLDRLSRSLMDFAALMERSRKKGWSLVALDLGVDTTTPAGEMMASVVASVAQYERRLIGVRTKDAMAVKRSQGVRMGRPRLLPGGRCPYPDLGQERSHHAGDRPDFEPRRGAYGAGWGTLARLNFSLNPAPNCVTFVWVTRRGPSAVSSGEETNVV